MGLFLRILPTLVIAGAAIFMGWSLKATETERDSLRLEVAAQAETLRLTKRVEATTSTVLSKRVQSKSAITQRANDVQVEIEKRIPADSGCMLSPDFRLLHDSAATDTPVPQAPTGFDARAVTPKEVATTTAENYAVCHDNADQLRNLQQWIKGVSE